MKLRAVAIVGLLIVLVLGTVGVASAALTPEQGPVSKYSRSQVYYIDHGSQIQVGHRYFRGARDGGAQKWRMLEIKDKESGTSQVTHGPSAWFTNYNIGSFTYFVGESQPWYASGATVEVGYRFEYYECSPGCYYWYTNHVHTMTP